MNNAIFLLLLRDIIDKSCNLEKYPFIWDNLLNVRKSDKQIIFVYGMSGSGKDTISNHLRDYHNFMKLRLAKVIKEIITEKNLINMDKLDELKRNDPYYRTQHHVVSEELRKGCQIPYNLSRCYQLLIGDSVEFEIIKNNFKKYIFCDVRTIEEASMLLTAGATGLFLTRENTKEYKDNKHFTEKDMLSDERFIELIKNDTKKQIYVIDNSTLSEPNKIIYYMLDNYIRKTDCSAFELISVAYEIIFKK